MIQIYHNPRCRKSREALELLKSKTSEFQVIEYLKDVPSASQLADVLKKMAIPAEKLLRKNEQIFKDQFKGKQLTDSEWIAVMIENPKLIERPIVINGNKAAIGRPPENILEIL